MGSFWPRAEVRASAKSLGWKGTRRAQRTNEVTCVIEAGVTVERHSSGVPGVARTRSVRVL